MKSQFGYVTQQAPLYLHREGERSKRFGSFDSKILKTPLCAECNNRRTQPHDLAWAQLSTFLGAQKPEPNAIIRASDVFPEGVAQQMLNVHLYFVKLFGCRIVDVDAPIDTRAFSNAILNGTACQQLYLRFGQIIPFPAGKEMAGFSKIYEYRYPDGSSVFSWLYGVGCMSVQILHATNAALLPQGVWHPRLGGNNLMMAKFP